MYCMHLAFSLGVRVHACVFAQREDECVCCQVCVNAGCKKSFKAFFILGCTSVGVYVPFIYWGEGGVHISLYRGCVCCHSVRYVHMHITESVFKHFLISGCPFGGVYAPCIVYLCAS